jgi:hypothetical protein
MGVVIETCVKYPGGPTRIKGTEYIISNLSYSSTVVPGIDTSAGMVVLPRAAAGTRGQYSTLHYTGASMQ